MLLGYQKKGMSYSKEERHKGRNSKGKGTAKEGHSMGMGIARIPEGNFKS